MNEYKASINKALLYYFFKELVINNAWMKIWNYDESNDSNETLIKKKEVERTNQIF